MLSVFTIFCRLSEPNMASISGQLEELYMAHSRKDMNDTLTSALMGACVTASAMPSRLMMEHVLLVGVLHHTVGIEVQLYLCPGCLQCLMAIILMIGLISASLCAVGGSCVNSFLF